MGTMETTKEGWRLTKIGERVAGRFRDDDEGPIGEAPRTLRDGAQRLSEIEMVPVGMVSLTDAEKEIVRRVEVDNSVDATRHAEAIGRKTVDAEGMAGGFRLLRVDLAGSDGGDVQAAVSVVLARTNRGGWVLVGYRKQEGIKPTGAGPGRQQSDEERS